MQTRLAFDARLTELYERMFRIGTMVEAALSKAIKAVMEHDGAAAKEVVEGDSAINLEVQQLHNEALLLIATQQPMARDLRLISVVISLLPELERMGDYAATISKVQRRMMAVPNHTPLAAMPQQVSSLVSDIGRRTIEIMHAGLEAINLRDHSFADRVAAQDDEIDHLYAELFDVTVKLSATNPELTAEAVHLLTLAHNLERVGDRVTNVAEQIVYLMTGEVVALNY
jgi:phosphate transport system protein